MFRVELDKFITELSYKIDNLEINFGNFKKFFTFESKEIFAGPNQKYPALEWKLNSEFYYQLRNINFLNSKKLEISCKNDQGLELASTEIDLYSLATGPELQQLDLKYDQNIVGKVSFKVTMSEEKIIQTFLHSFYVITESPCDCYIKYWISGSSIKYNTITSQKNVQHLWKDSLTPLLFKGSLKDFLHQDIFIQLFKIIKGKHINFGELKIPMMKYISYHEKITRFQEEFYINHSPSYFLEGMINFRNLPEFAQIQNGINTSNGIINGTILIPGVKLPKLKQEVIVQPKSTSKTIPTIDTKTLPQTLKFEKNYILSFNFPTNFISTVQCNSPIGELKFSYFEIYIENSGEFNQITIGLSRKGFPSNLIPGTDELSYGYRSDTGMKYHNDESITYGPFFSEGDTIGCGIEDNGIYYTKNGSFLGYTNYTKDEHELFPTISLSSRHSKVFTNFGQKKLKFHTKYAKLPQNWKLKEDSFKRMFFENKEKRMFSDPRFQNENEDILRIENDKLINSFTKSITSSSIIKNKKIVKKWKPIENLNLLVEMKKIPLYTFVPEKYKKKVNEGNSFFLDDEHNNVFIPSIRLIAKSFEELNLREDVKFLTIGPAGLGFISSLASSLIKGKTTLIDNSEENLDLVHDNIIEFNKSKGESISIKFEKRNIFSNPNLKNIYQLPNSFSENYDFIFCSYAITRNSLHDFEYLLSKQGGFVIACIEGIVYALHFNGSTWFEKPLLKCEFPDFDGYFNENEIIEENYLRVQKYLSNFGIMDDIINRAIDDFKTEGLKKLMDFSSLFHQINKMESFPYEIVFHHIIICLLKKLKKFLS
eukprot:gene580-8090_t